MIASAIVLLPVFIAALLLGPVYWRGAGLACYGFVLILVFTYYAVRPGTSRQWLVTASIVVIGLCPGLAAGFPGIGVVASTVAVVLTCLLWWAILASWREMGVAHRVLGLLLPVWGTIWSILTVLATISARQQDWANVHPN
jgi:hypothetical protein